jgi:hypothetical protein
MYTLQLDFIADGKVSDGQTIDFGVRQIDSYLTPENYRAFVLNGRKVLIKGAGWTDDIFLRNSDDRNAIEVSLENLGRVTLATAIAETSGTSRIRNLVSEYNTLAGVSLTAATALINEGFLRYAIREINSVVDAMQDMSVLYNDGSFETFTPKEDMRVKIVSKFQRALETAVEYAAFHDQFVKPDVDYTTLNYWQSAQSPYEVQITRPSDQTDVTVENVVVLIHDRDAMGVYKIDEDVLTTPVNAAGAYYNTYWHEKQLRFIDLSENFVVFTLN